MCNAKTFLLIFGCVFTIITSCKKDETTPTDSEKPIGLSADTLEIKEGSIQTLYSKYYASDQLSWSSSDTNIVKISSLGEVRALHEGTATVTVKRKSSSTSESCFVIVSGEVIDISISKVVDVGVGAEGSIFVISNDSSKSSEGYSVYKVSGNNYVKMNGIEGVRITVSPDGTPWVVNKSNQIYQYKKSNNTWSLLPGKATDISIGADGSVYAIGTVFVSSSGGYNIMHWNGNDWDTMNECAGTRIAVNPQGIPYVVNLSDIVYQYDGSFKWNPIYGIEGHDIGIGAEGSVFVTEDSDNASVYKLTNASWWNQISDINATNISVTPLGQPVYIDKKGILHKP